MSSHRRSNRPRARVAAALCAAAGLALSLAACGGSKAPGIILAPSGGQTTAPVPTTPKPPPQLASKPTVSVQPSDCATKTLLTRDLVPGTGPVAQTGKSITVNYVGVLCKDGKEFDSSWSTGKPFAPFTLGQGSVIRGWDQGLVGMKVGGRRELVIPASLGYGNTGSPPKIPGKATLVFVVDLLQVQ